MVFKKNSICGPGMRIKYFRRYIPIENPDSIVIIRAYLFDAMVDFFACVPDKVFIKFIGTKRLSRVFSKPKSVFIVQGMFRTLCDIENFPVEWIMTLVIKNIVINGKKIKHTTRRQPDAI